jgi:Domain of unknown function (DUF4382)
MKKILFACTVFSLAIFACAKDNTTVASVVSTTEGTIELSLTDGPGMFESVNIDIIGAEIKTNKDTAKNDGWRPMTVRTGVFDILALSNGVDTLLGATTLPLADIKEIRLLLGTRNTVKVGGVTYPLTIPSGGDSGLKLKFEHKLLAGVSYKVKMDFDAAKSIKEEKKGEFKLRPRLRLITVVKSLLRHANQLFMPSMARTLLHRLSQVLWVVSYFKVWMQARTKSWLTLKLARIK